MGVGGGVRVGEAVTLMARVTVRGELREKEFPKDRELEVKFEMVRVELEVAAPDKVEVLVHESDEENDVDVDKNGEFVKLMLIDCEYDSVFVELVEELREVLIVRGRDVVYMCD